MLYVKMYAPNSTSKYGVRVTRKCPVECPKCLWKGTRTVHFDMDVNHRPTTDEMQARILGKEDRPTNCPKCQESYVKFVGVPCATKPKPD